MGHPTGWLKVMISPLCGGKKGDIDFFIMSRGGRVDRIGDYELTGICSSGRVVTRYIELE